jgi:hypothetical protein
LAAGVHYFEQGIHLQKKTGPGAAFGPIEKTDREVENKGAKPTHNMPALRSRTTRRDMPR